MPRRFLLPALILACASKVACAQTGSLSAPFTLSVAPGSVYANAPAALTATGLPTNATGTVAFTDGASTIATTKISGTSAAQYQAFGDSITLGASGSSYASLLAAQYGFALFNEGVTGAITCDVLPSEILAGGFGPMNAGSALTSFALTSLMTGSVDAVNNSASYDPVFAACHQAALAWLAIPREDKILATDPGVSITSGAWAADPTNFNTLTTTAAGTVRYTITTAGAPVYVWQMLSDALPGTFTIAVDGIPGATIYSTQPSPAIASRNNPQLKTFGLIRLPAASGAHTVDVIALSGTVGILATATAPGASDAHPTVLVTDVPNQLPGNTAAIAQYTQAVQADASLLLADGLDLRYVPTQAFMPGAASEMLDNINPNAIGQAQLAAAFAGTFDSLSTAAYVIFTNTPAYASATFANRGLHALTASYSGDSSYAASTASASITVLPQQTTLTALATPATHAYAGSSVAFTASVTPASATGAATFYDGTQLLATLPLSGGATVFATTSLVVGIHNLTAVYGGDTADSSSASPTLAIEIELTPTSLALTPIAATATYGPATTLTASITPANATGAITFFDSATTLAQATLGGGSASISVVLAIGSHSITATYSGDASDLTANSAAVTTAILPITTETTLNGLPATAPYSDPLTLTAQVTPTNAAGTITFRDAALGTLAQATIVNGAASITTNSLAVGAHNFTAIYSGDATHSSSTSPAVSTQIAALSTTVTLGALAPNYTAASPLTLNAQILPATATGTILFRDAILGTLGLSTVSHGAASLSLSSLPSGSYSITATYSGDADDAPCTSSAVTTQIALATTNTTLAPPATAPYAAPVTLTAAVTPATASGVVQFYDGPTIAATALLSNGIATAQIATLSTGTHLLRASYLGDPLNAPSASAAASTVITPNSTATSITLAQTTIPASGLIVFNVRVGSTGASAPGGSVTILSGTTPLLAGTLANADNGSAYATLTMRANTLGAATVTASYSGDANDQPSTSAAITYTVVATPTTAILTLSSFSVPPQSNVVLTATILSPTQAPTGSVVFLSNGSPFATSTINASGIASATLASPPVGTYALSATFVPSGLFAASSASAQTFVVTLPLALTLTPSPLNMTPGATQTANLTITPLSGFRGAMQLACVSPVAYIACTVDAPTSISAPVNAIIHIAVPTSTAAAIFPFAIVLLAPLLLHRRRSRPLLALLLSVVVLATSSCANGGDFFSVPSGANEITLNANAAGVTVTTSLTVNIIQ